MKSCTHRSIAMLVLTVLLLPNLSAIGATADGVADTFIQLRRPGEGVPDMKIQVPIGARVVIVAPEVLAPDPDRPVSIGIGWNKNGVLFPLPERSYNLIVIPSARPEDSGSYWVTTGNGQVVMSNLVRIHIGEEPVFTNFSSRLKLQSGDDIQICGFVISGKKPKALLVRTVGNSLRPFGIDRVTERPRFRLRNANGFEVFLSPRGVVRPSGYWESVFARAGAFPLFGTEEPLVAFDAGQLQPGTYTIHVTDDRKIGGEVLVEVYELPPEN